MIRALIAFLLASGFAADEQADLEAMGAVRVHYVTTPHPHIKAHETAKAIRTESGQRWILVNMGADQAEMNGWFLHEMAHHLAWYRHGEGIDPHGPEFRNTCRKLVTERADYYCKGD